MYKYREEFGIHIEIKSTLIVPLTRKTEIKPLIEEDKYHLYAICKRKILRFDKDFLTITDEKKLKTQILLTVDEEDEKRHPFPVVLQLTFDSNKSPFSHKLVSNKKEIEVYDCEGKLVYEANAAIVLQEAFDQLRHLHFENGEIEEAKTVEALCRLIGLEVLYIGQSYGSGDVATTDGYERLEEHKPLQKILTKLFNSPGEDVWLMLFSIDEEIEIHSLESVIYQVVNDDLNQKHKENMINFNITPKHLLTAVEALLIGYFRPEFNSEFNKDNKLFPYPNKEYQQILDLDCNGFGLRLSTRERVADNSFVSTRIFTPKQKNQFAVHTIHTPMDQNRDYIYKDIMGASPIIFLNELSEYNSFKAKNPI
ncbi:hypothetical protein [Peribacillus simplex]|uniref:Uncharacterized protein n=1 Tax=Peribacillus simplex NBRC 15720 = DSM 1321 TaxID=1349754 RepID=A0A223EN08_9BACI|nr:hypothetical protein [Peribacillus simplex]ASS96642.1 hypothetical protein BS1321_23685 [Peribacillus simplex NBRC 15720 = DSM 1321]MEC1395958.1 hypothetical protein [Peribacillus simplex]